MKKLMFSSLLVATAIALAAKSYGQGFIQFQNQNFGGLNPPATSVDAPVTFGESANHGGRIGVAGVAVGSDFMADLLYSLNGGTSYTLLTAAAANDPSYPAAFGVPGAADGDTANFAGYFFGGTVTIPGYASGPVWLIVEAWQGGSSYATTTHWSGQSAPFMLASITPSGSTALPTDMIGMSPFVVGIPEPSIFALASFGAAGLMAFRRKK